jgi:enoyl-CoA hydratase/carnithine racemase
MAETLPSIGFDASAGVATLTLSRPERRNGFLTRAAGAPRALGLALFGDRLSAEQAEAWGLIWKGE